MTGHKWERITPLGSACGYDFAEIDSLQHQWLNVRKEREDSSPDVYSGFLERLGRSWAIETGIIEGLYEIDRGVTKTLVENGILADLIDRGATNKDPQSLVQVIRDHQQAAEFVYESIRKATPFSRQFIRELHLILTQNQPYYTAVDQFGTVFETPLDRGDFKKLPNNPTRPDGSIHEYCPPIFVNDEIERLVDWYQEYQGSNTGYHPILAGAWLHHRFTQIHPFQDGNGRVARAILIWHLVKERYLPVVVSRDDRTRYLEALESADGGDLLPFVDQLVQLEKRTILEALGEPDPVNDAKLVDQVVDHIVGQIKRQNRDRESQLRSVSDIASILQKTGAERLSVHGDQIAQRLNDSGMPLRRSIDQGGPGDREHWYQAQVVETARLANHWANLKEPRFFVKVALNPETPSRNPRLVFVVSLHHIGHQLTGVMAGTAFTEIEYYPTEDHQGSEDFFGLRFKNCAVAPFTFTWNDDAEAITGRFNNWVEECLSVALRYWSDFIA